MGLLHNPAKTIKPDSIFKQLVEAQGPPGGSMAQYYGSTNHYDMWTNSAGDVYAMGSTQPCSNPYNHQGRVIVTLTSPLGQVASWDTGF